MYDTEIFLELKSIGREIRRQGYSFERLQKSATLFWEMTFHENLDFEPRNIAFVDASILKQHCQHERAKQEESRKIYHSLPQSLREHYSVDDVIASYEHSQEASLLGSMRKKVIGLYVPRSDKMYILNTAQEELKTTIAVHELTHRQVYQKQRGKINPKLVLFPEEDFCRDVENMYWGLLFNQDNSWSRYERNDLRRDYEIILNPRTHARFTKDRIQFYKALLGGERV